MLSIKKSISQVALTIYHQITSIDPLAILRWDANGFVAGENNLMFFVKTSYPKSKIVINYNYGLDLYDITLGRITEEYFWEILEESEEIYFDNLVSVIDSMIKNNV